MREEKQEEGKGKKTLMTLTVMKIMMMMTLMTLKMKMVGTLTVTQNQIRHRPKLVHFQMCLELILKIKDGESTKVFFGCLPYH